MQFFRNTNIETSTICFLRLLAYFLAKIKIIIYCFLKFFFNIFGIFRIEINQIINSKNFSINDLVFWVIRRLCVITLITQNAVSHSIFSFFRFVLYFEEQKH